jgi:D-alanyl-lipoteichoic acid acyltransferase DltB (MBOAT superfamily)
MIFSSYEFIFAFLPVAFVGYFLAGRYSHLLAALWLGLASLAFYGYWNPKFLAVLMTSIIFNYAAGYAISRISGAQKTIATAAAIAINLAVLGFFKYANFFIEVTNETTNATWSSIDVVLPLGISFFTFTQISFLVDVYRGIAKEYNFIHYLLFVTYFPHLIAGPILHHKQMMPQFAAAATYLPNTKNIAIGLSLFAIGLAKKVLIADNLAPTADRIFAAAHEGVAVTFFDAWAGTLAYTFQLYFDFSGYSDMAIGLALLFNVKLPLNFDSPYRSLNITEFWRRWHISLSTFLRDYLYIPLGGNRHGKPRRYLNLLITMLLGGLWHGASWNFVLWGGLHGVYLSLNHLWRALKKKLGWSDARTKSATATSWAFTFVCVCVAWVLFRAETISDASIILAGIGGLNGISVPESMAHNDIVMRICDALSVSVAGDGFVPQLDTHGNLYREFRIVVVVAAIIALAIPAIDGAAKDALRETTAAEACQDSFRIRFRRVFSSPYAAVCMGALFGIALAFIQKDTPFLYFQF